jgi:hypothetical protein
MSDIGLSQLLQNNKPNLNEKSKKVYISMINGIGRKINKNLSTLSGILQNLEIILEFVKDLPFNTRKTRLAALLAFIPNEPELENVRKTIQQMMMSDISKYKEHSESGDKTQSQKENWVEWKDVVSLHNTLLKKVNKILKQPLKDIDEDEREFVRNVVILSMFVMIAPRRSIDYTEMKFRNGSKNDNFYDSKNSMFIFNKFKTKKVYGTQEVDVPKDLKILLDKYVKILPKNQEYLFEDKGKKLENFQLTKIINGLFRGRKVSVNILRHSYLTHLYGDKLDQMKQTASNMGHSLDTALNTYVKK